MDHLARMAGARAGAPWPTGRERLEAFKGMVLADAMAHTRDDVSLTDKPAGRRGDSVPPRRLVPPGRIAIKFPVLAGTELTSNFSRREYLDTVERAIEYIRAGDVFQVNLAQRLLHPARDDSLSLYLRMRRRNPATFAAYFDLGEFQIVSASPERFLKVRRRPRRSPTDQGHAPPIARGPRPICSQATSCCKAKRTGPKT